MIRRQIILVGLSESAKQAMFSHADALGVPAEVATAQGFPTSRVPGTIIAHPINQMPAGHESRYIAVGRDIGATEQALALEQGASEIIDLAWAPRLIEMRLTSLFAQDEQQQSVATFHAAKTRELADARALQLALVPPPMIGDRLAIDVVLEPALELGGDLVDYIRIASGQIVLALGDVAGKGAAAALTMARTHTLLRSLALRSYAEEIFVPPSLAAGRLNGMLTIKNEGCIFVTMFLGLLDPATGELAYIRCGQIPPFLRRQDGTIERLDAVGGLPLGLDEDFVYPVGRVVLAPGDTLLVVSDGVTEAEAPDGQLLDDEPVAEWLTQPREELASLIALTRKHEQGGDPTDDLSAMLIRRR